MSSMGNPLSSMNGAAGDLGLSAAAKQQANAAGELAKKKKLQEQMNLKAAGVGGQPSAFQSLTGFGTP